MKNLRISAALALLAPLLGCSAAPITRAIKRGDAVAVAARIDQGQDLNARFGIAGQTPLMIAVERRRLEIAGLLLDRGADINLRRNGTGALTLASLGGNKEMTKFLLSRGAQAERRDILLAQGPDRAEIVALLKAAEAKQSSAGAAVAPSTFAVSDVDAPAYKTSERADDLALIVAVPRSMDGPEARFALEDAAAVRRHLIALGWPSRNIVLLTDEAAGRAGLGKYLERWLPNNVVENSRVFFYFAGCGAADASGRPFLLPWDGDAGQLEATGYPLSRLYEKLNALKARAAIAVLDTGFSGAGPRSAAAAKAKTPAARIDLGARDLGDVIALVAAQDAEPLGLAPEEGHGALTYFLLRGLNGAAVDASGAVTIKGLSRYARGQVADAAAREGRRQTPLLLTGALGEADLRLR
ncbi:MAG: hypothetical protein A2V88_01945 [Elusimicrobia bacterium RBG_16_66_12]|nr:MAG: hypothetical protein A2V88_01945 [Elusimicrobia bacterium RBG_16_66_12]